MSLILVYRGWTLIQWILIIVRRKYSNIKMWKMELSSTSWAITPLWSSQSTASLLNQIIVQNTSECSMIRIWIMLTCLRSWLYNKAPLAWGEFFFFHCEIRTNLSKKISGHIKEVILAPIKWTISVLWQFIFLPVCPAYQAISPQ